MEASQRRQRLQFDVNVIEQEKKSLMGGINYFLFVSRSLINFLLPRDEGRN